MNSFTKKLLSILAKMLKDRSISSTNKLQGKRMEGVPTKQENLNSCQPACSPYLDPNSNKQTKNC